MSDTEDCSCGGLQQVTCENDCTLGFSVFYSEHSLILLCLECETEYEISPPGLAQSAC